MQRRALVVTSAVFGLTAVVCAALGAHVIPADEIKSVRMWTSALQLHLFHAAALLAIAVLAEYRNSQKIYLSGFIIALGAFLFSATLYLRAAGLNGLPGQLTPLGGLIAISGWGTFIMTLIRKNPI